MQKQIENLAIFYEVMNQRDLEKKKQKRLSPLTALSFPTM
jgi:hypothetical protein